MRSTTVRINPTAHIILRRIAKQSGESMQSALTKAVELYRRKNFLQMANEAFANIRRNPKAWQEEMKEREDWDLTLLDDIKDS